MYMDEIEVYYKFKYFLMPITGYRLDHTRTSPCVQCGVINCLFDIAYEYVMKPEGLIGRVNPSKVERVTGLYCCSESCFNMFLLSGKNMDLYADGHMEISGG